MKTRTYLTVGQLLSVSGGACGETDWGIGRCLGARVTPNRFGSLLVAVLLILSGCGGSNYRYSKPGASQQQMLQDSFECKQISRQPYIAGTGGMLLGGSEPNFEVWKECLEARGYTVSEESEDQRDQAQAASESLQAEYKWLLAEKDAINDAAAALSRDRTDTPQRRDALAAHQQRAAEYNRRLSVYEQRRTASSSPAK